MSVVRWWCFFALVDYAGTQSGMVAFVRGLEKLALYSNVTRISSRFLVQASLYVKHDFTLNAVLGHFGHDGYSSQLVNVPANNCEVQVW